jgi:hypothetical protein
MADKKISALTSASTPLVGTEVLPIVQSGATVKATIANIVGAGTSPGSFTTLTNTGLHTNYPQATIGTTAGSEVIAGRDVSVVGGTAQQVYNKLYRHTAGTNFIGTSWRLQNFADSTAASYLQWGSPTEWNDIGIYNDAGNGLRISTAGNAVVNTGNLVIGTSGQGIDFSATAGTGTSELLADYEEGTWTPVVVGTTSAGTGTYTVQQAHYVKVGNVVNFTLALGWSAHTGTGNIEITGLPFSIPGSQDTAPCSVFCWGLTFLGQLTAVTTGTKVQLYQIATASAATAVAMDTAVAALNISGFYFTS